jgi:hypothetical protein
MVSDELTTKPTIQTVLEQINGLEDRLQSQIGALEDQLQANRSASNRRGDTQDRRVFLKNDVGLIRFDLSSFRTELQLFRRRNGDPN